MKSLKQELEDRGLLYQNSSEDLFEKSGLPMEDTKSSRDKYAEIAEELDADLLVIPYYGQLFNATNALIFMMNKYEAVTSLQMYSVEKNDFLSRVDIEGKTKVFILMYPPIGLPLLFIPTKSHYKKAFRKSLTIGINQFAQKYPAKTNPSENSSSGEYSKYSLDELQQMKSKAAEDKDFKKAGEIKKEIERRSN